MNKISIIVFKKSFPGIKFLKFQIKTKKYISFVINSRLRHHKRQVKANLKYKRNYIQPNYLFHFYSEMHDIGRFSNSKISNSHSFFTM